MNLHDNHRSELRFINYNQDFSCLVVGTTKGFVVYRTNPFGKCYEHLSGGVRIAEMLFSTSLIALVGSGDDPLFSPRKLKIFNTRNTATICELNFVTSIVNVKLNRKRMIVVLEAKIKVYDMATMNLMHTIETITNPSGLVALSPTNNSYMAYPVNNLIGDICVFDSLSLHTVKTTQAHKMPVTTLAINTKGTMMATASETGTVIRVFDLADVKKPRCVFRRGSSPATVYSLCFSMDSTLLCASSSNGTVHIFKIPKQDEATYTDLVGTYLPEYLNDMWEPARAFAWFKLGMTNVITHCCFGKYNSEIYVTSADGYFRTYSLDSTNGGECKKLSDDSLLKTSI